MNPPYDSVMEMKNTKKPVGRPRSNGKPHITRRDVFAASAQLIAEHGYSGTSMRMIAAFLDASTASIFNLFPSKEALVNELIEFMADISLTFYAQLNARALDPAVALYKSVYEETYALASADADFPSLFYLPELSKDVFVPAQAIRAKLVSHYRKLISTGISGGVFIDVPSQITAEQVVQLTETSILTNKRATKVTPKKQAIAAADFALRGILSNPQSLPMLQKASAEIDLVFIFPDAE